MLLLLLTYPLLAALLPILRGTSVTVHDAINDYGVGDAGSTDRLGRLLARIKGISQPLQLSLRNTFRRKTMKYFPFAHGVITVIFKIFRQHLVTFHYLFIILPVIICSVVPT